MLSLAPLRKFLLEEFTTYHAAWVFLCRRCTIKKSRCVRNLARMLRGCQEDRTGDGFGFQKDRQVMKKLTKSSTKAIEEAKEKEEKKKMEKEKEKFEKAVEGSKTVTEGAVEATKTGASESPKKKANLFSSMLNKTLGAVSKTKEAAASAVGKTLTSASAAIGLDGGDDEDQRKKEKKMMEYLKPRVTEDVTQLEKICMEIMDQLDYDGDGNIVVQADCFRRLWLA
eukprot:s2981_g6.t2